jgi:hypothetical protein
VLQLVWSRDDLTSVARCVLILSATSAQEEVRLANERSAEMAERNAMLETRGRELEVRCVKLLSRTPHIC